jgi:Uma2 family endonuclease
MALGSSTNIISPIDQKIHGVPTMVAEIVSSDEARYRIHKFQVYFENGVTWYWLLTQTLAIEEYHLTT